MMKNIIIILILSSLANLAHSQGIINISTVDYKIEKIDSSKFEIRGWWKIIDKKLSYNGEVKKQPITPFKQFYGNKVFFSEGYIYALTPILYNLIIKPRYKENYYSNIKKNSRTTYLQNFFENLLYLEIYENGEEIPTATIIVLNENLIAYSEVEDEFVFMERMLGYNAKEEWPKEGDFEIIKYKGYSGVDFQKILLSNDKVKSGKGFLEFIYIVKDDRKNMKISLKSSINKVEDDQKETGKDYNLFDSVFNTKIILHDYVSLNTLQSNVLKVMWNHLDLEKEWKFMWRIINTQKRKVKMTKVWIFSEPFIRTKMYLIKGNEIEILEEKEVKSVKWIKIKYYSNKTVEGWIKKSDVE